MSSVSCHSLVNVKLQVPNLPEGEILVDLVSYCSYLLSLITNNIFRRYLPVYVFHPCKKAGVRPIENGPSPNASSQSSTCLSVALPGNQIFFIL